MKKILNINIIILLFLTIASSLWGQRKIYDEKIEIVSGKIEKVGDSLYVDMIMDFSKLKVDKNQSLTLTPILVGNKYQMEFPDVLINGSTRHKAYLRAQALNSKQNSDNMVVYAVKASNTSQNRLQYKDVVLYEDWMAHASLDVKEDLCGCGGHEQFVFVERVINKKVPPYQMIPQIAYKQPQVESVKYRSEEWESYIDYPVNKADVLSDYMDNNKELSRIESILNSVKTDSLISVSQIDIVGFASPEGDVKYNEKLSKNRAESFKKYLSSKIVFPTDVYHIEYGGENWDGLLNIVKNSDLSYKDNIVKIIESTEDPVERKKKLKAFDNGVPYQQMLTNIYPKLRKVISRAHYTVRPFTVEEGKTLIKTRPQQLSLDEMFRVANTYDKGSAEFIDVFEIAVRMYPENEVANLNAAAAALSSKDIVNAEKYLGKTDKSTPEYSNNMGVLWLLKGDRAQAKEFFVKAANEGSDTAKYNLSELEKSTE